MQHARIEIFIDEEKTNQIVETIMHDAHTGLTGDGIIAVLPVEHLYKIKSQEEI